MSRIEAYCRLQPDIAIDVEGKNILHPRLRRMHLDMVPFLCVMNAIHWSKNPESGKLALRQGQVVGHRDLQPYFEEMFERLVDLKMPTGDAIPISQSPGSSDAFSMARNRTIVYRPDVIGSPDNPQAPPSEHMRGSAIDLSPLDNAIVNADYTVEPKEAIGREPDLDMVFKRHPHVVLALTKGMSRETEWGGNWDNPASDRYYGLTADGQLKHILNDPHHFEVVPELAVQLEVPEFFQR